MIHFYSIPFRKRKKVVYIFKTLETFECDFSWKRKPVKMQGGTRIQIGDRENDFDTNTQQAVINKLSDLDELSNIKTLLFCDILRTVDYEDYLPRVGATKSKRYKYIKQILPHKIKITEDEPSHLQGEGMKRVIPSNI